MSLGGDIVEDMYVEKIRIFLTKLEEIKDREIRNRSLPTFGVICDILEEYKNYFEYELR
jgi:hypothetical protein